MIIRLMEHKDKDEVIKMIIEFGDEVLESQGINLDPVTIIDQIGKFLDTSFVIENNKGLAGILMGSIVDLPGSKDKVYQESIWFVKKSYRGCGKGLIDKLEGWCKEQGVNYIIASHIATPQAKMMERFYQRRGFKPYEVNYIKHLIGGRNVERD